MSTTPLNTLARILPLKQWTATKMLLLRKCQRATVRVWLELSQTPSCVPKACWLSGSSLFLLQTTASNSPSAYRAMHKFITPFITLIVMQVANAGKISKRSLLQHGHVLCHWESADKHHDRYHPMSHAMMASPSQFSWRSGRQAARLRRITRIRTHNRRHLRLSGKS